MKIAIIDYGGGNLFSIKKAFDFLKIRAEISSDPREWEKSNALVFPGQGNFVQAVENLRLNGNFYTLKDLLGEKPYLGICLGMQILFEESEEAVDMEMKGLSILKGKVKKLKSFKLPHLGWNQVEIINPSVILKDIPNNSFFYFVHSYYVECEKDIIVGLTDYEGTFPSIIQKDNIFGVQFHPEKSSTLGLKIIKNFVEHVYDSYSCC
ncbi:MAG: imidazole glycerol phosphate synthase subunit HisH [Dictyoglomus sp. NZ13-RE01]|nr:MAG: imidazole glycerol phosphate synthase subunit HisH [Dictyoglomus sp. NZ13-RE01]